MAQLLVWVAFGFSGVVLAYAVLHAVRVPGVWRPVPRALFVINGLAAAGALITLPMSAPWSPGQGLFAGVLCGVLSVDIPAILLPRLLTAGRRERFLAMAACAASAAAALSVVTALFSGSILDTLIGYAIGAVLIALPYAGAVRASTNGSEELPGSDERQGSEEHAQAVELAALLAVALAATTYLAVFHRGPAGLREWIPLPALFVAAAAVCLTLRAALERGGAGPEPARASLTAAVVGLPLLALGAVISFKLGGTPGFLKVIAAGLAAFTLLAWLGSSSGPAASSRFPVDGALLGALVLLGAAVFFWRELHGFGLGLGLLAGMAVALSMPRAAGSAGSAVVRGGLVLGLLLVLTRVFEESVRVEAGAVPERFYDYVAMVLGALLPLVLAGGGVKARGGGDGGMVARLVVAGVLAVAAPLAVWVLLGSQSQAAMLVGLAIGTALLLVRSSASPGTAGVIAAAMALSAIQFTALVEPLASWTRPQRIALLAAVGGIALVALLFSAWMDRKQPAGARSPAA